MIIPKIFHAIWVGSGLPMTFVDNLDQWASMHPDWVMKVWTDNGDLDWLTNRRLFDDAEKIVRPDAVGQFRSDVARYEILNRFGGFYIDCDTYPLRKIDNALNGYPEFAAVEDASAKWVGNTYLGSVADSAVMQDLIRGLPHRILYKGHARLARAAAVSGPRYLTPIWLRHRCHIDPAHLWFPQSYQDAKHNVVRAPHPDAYAMHTWNHLQTQMRRS